MPGIVLGGGKGLGGVHADSVGEAGVEGAEVGDRKGASHPLWLAHCAPRKVLKPGRKIFVVGGRQVALGPRLVVGGTGKLGHRGAKVIRRRRVGHLTGGQTRGRGEVTTALVPPREGVLEGRGAGVVDGIPKVW